jgi:hypothetical protein
VVKIKGDADIFLISTPNSTSVCDNGKKALAEAEEREYKPED